MPYYRQVIGSIEFRREIYSQLPGPLAGTRLDPIEHGVFYAFAWLAFNPDARVERPKH